ncbi:M1 family metallopeptidase [Kangiella sp. TOML190]|uniref:M1 family metallopeptidase n=1 Tax=Kangiella sp. TOML190 TaxID=2931351 RepID=UPI0020403AEE|nr:M1 family metallopeptidase [Kangiella sp. TOML190]
MNYSMLKTLIPIIVVGSLVACQDGESEQSPTAESQTSVSSAAEVKAEAMPIEKPVAENTSAKADLSYLNDEHSYANKDEVLLKHLDLNLEVLFDKKQLKGYVDLKFERLQADAKKLVLDTRDLTIEKVSSIDGQANESAAEFELAEKDPVLGSKLTIKLKDGEDTVRVYYHSNPEASGLQWLTPEQTAGKKEPFMFSQAQAIHARSFIPVQDSPDVRVTYKANIRTPKQLLAVMSAFNEPDTELDGDYHFDMPQAIPPYLIAIGVGDLRFKAMGERTGVYSEVAYLDAAVKEFEDTEQMIDITEKMYGPYLWGRYDLLILPPSFPFGGMENPRLSFITPTVIAGDKSLVNLIAHELAHSWSGNLVTNATWRDLWLNEGFTSYVENRIMEELFGVERANMENALSVQGLREQVKTLPVGDTILHITLDGRDPDDTFSGVPYTKGQMFLVFLEQRFGREVFDQFLNQYFGDHAFKSLTTPEFEVYLQKHLIDKYPGKVTQAELNEWLHAPMLPEFMPNPQSDAFANVDKARQNWLDKNVELADLPTDKWSIHEWLHFINNLPKDISLEQMAQLDKAYNLTASSNNEVAHAWLKLAIQRDYQVVNQRLEDYLISIGRRKLIVPLYKELMTSDKGESFAKRVYQIARPGYHPLAQGTVDAIVNAENTE